MTKIITITLVLVFHVIHAQQEFEVFQTEFVECFPEYKNGESFEIFDKIEGTVIAKFEALKKENCYYKFAIAESQGGWLKIANFMVAPGCQDHSINNDIEFFKGNWIKSDIMKIDIADLDVDPQNGIKFYANPDRNSEIVFQSGQYLSTNLIEVKGLWAKVVFAIDNEIISGWLERSNQCAYPWTTCTNMED